LVILVITGGGYLNGLSTLQKLWWRRNS